MKFNCFQVIEKWVEQKMGWIGLNVEEERKEKKKERERGST